MATTNLTGVTLTSGVPDRTGKQHRGAPGFYVAKVIVDLTALAMTTADVYQVFAVPADTQVMNVRCRIVTPAVGTSMTADIGIAGTTGWNAAIDAKATADTWTTSVCGTDAEAVAPTTSASGLQGTFYDAADTIDFTVAAATAITAGPKVELYFTCVDFN